MQWLALAAMLAAVSTEAFAADAAKAEKPDASKAAKADPAPPKKASPENVEKANPAGSERPSPPAVEKKEPKKTDDKKAGALPPVQEIELLTGDGLRLTLSYYPGTQGKESVPVVLLHMWKQSRADYKDLALYLQSQGHAVAAPDLRGHGQSVRFKGARKDEDLKAATMPIAQFTKMVTEDMKAVKDFLWERNNAGELNLDKLCVVGAEMGASVAMDFAVYDALGYDNQKASYGPLKLGGFVRALVLLSPEWSFKNLSLRQAVATPRVQSGIAILILVGNGKADRKAFSEAKRVHGMFERHHPEPKGDDKIDRTTLFFIPLDTKLQGTKLLDPNIHAPEYIADFIDRRLLKSEESQEWVWKERKRPHE